LDSRKHTHVCSPKWSGMRLSAHDTCHVSCCLAIWEHPRRHPCRAAPPKSGIMTASVNGPLQRRRGLPGSHDFNGPSSIRGGRFRTHIPPTTAQEGRAHQHGGLVGRTRESGMSRPLTKASSWRTDTQSHAKLPFCRFKVANFWQPHMVYCAV